MKFLWFHLMPYPDLPDDFKAKHESVWVNIDPGLFDAERGESNEVTTAIARVRPHFTWPGDPRPGKQDHRKTLPGSIILGDRGHGSGNKQDHKADQKQHLF